MKEHLKAIIYQEEEGFWAEVPALPGCFSQGDTLGEVKANISEAAQLWIDTQNAEAREKAKKLTEDYAKITRGAAKRVSKGTTKVTSRTAEQPSIYDLVSRPKVVALSV